MRAPGPSGREEEQIRLKYHLPRDHPQTSSALTLCLMGASRQLHSETTKLFYAMNLFQGRTTEIVKFLARAGARAKYIRAVRIDARYAISYGGGGISQNFWIRLFMICSSFPE